MELPSTPERGKKIAEALNQLELYKDLTKHRLGIPINRNITAKSCRQEVKELGI